MGIRSSIADWQRDLQDYQEERTAPGDEDNSPGACSPCVYLACSVHGILLCPCMCCEDTPQYLTVEQQRVQCRGGPWLQTCSPILCAWHVMRSATSADHLRCFILQDKMRMGAFPPAADPGATARPITGAGSRASGWPRWRRCATMSSTRTSSGRVLGQRSATIQVWTWVWPLWRCCGRTLATRTSSGLIARAADTLHPCLSHVCDESCGRLSCGRNPPLCSDDAAWLINGERHDPDTHARA